MDHLSGGILVSRLSAGDRFLAGRIGAPPSLVAAILQFDRRAALRLLICRQPRPEQWGMDVAAIAAAVGVSSSRLDALLRPDRAA